ncbi:MAG: hypothetical protein JJU28_06465 [Cyclobacteriaceae bacterium]|nr:hypothetical protein [Cyclobacteriaceae bacterium]
MHTTTEIVCDFYLISCKSPSPPGLKYGRQHYDFEDGSLIFVAPQQVIPVEEFNKIKVFRMAPFFHPDILHGSSLSEKIRDNYNSHEALHLSGRKSKDRKASLKISKKRLKAIPTLTVSRL